MKAEAGDPTWVGKGREKRGPFYPERRLAQRGGPLDGNSFEVFVELSSAGALGRTRENGCLTIKESPGEIWGKDPTDEAEKESSND